MNKINFAFRQFVKKYVYLKFKIRKMSVHAN